VITHACVCGCVYVCVHVCMCVKKGSKIADVYHYFFPFFLGGEYTRVCVCVCMCMCACVCVKKRVC